MDVFKLYDQFTTGWVRIRTSLTSHLVAGMLLWLAGFTLPQPPVTFAALYQVPTAAIPPVLQGVGVLALASIVAALLIGAYGVLLGELGYFLDRILAFVFPMVSTSSRRPRIPRQALFIFAATLAPGRYEADDLERRIGELQTAHSAKVQEGLRALSTDYASLSRDGTTHYRNAAVFLLAWWVIPIAFPGSALANAVEAVYWRGFFALLLYFLIARSRLKFALSQTGGWYHQALSSAVEASGDYAARLTGAYRNPEPYDRLVAAYNEQCERRSAPSLADYVRVRFGRLTKGAGTDRPPLLTDWRRFGWDEAKNKSYDDPAWPAAYAKWRVALLADRLRAIFRMIKFSLGLQSR